MFGVIYDVLTSVLKKTNSIADHGQVFVGSSAKDLLDVEEPTFADDRDHRSLRFENLTHELVVFDSHTLPASHAEGCNLRVFPFASGRLVEELEVFGIRPGP